MIYLEETDQTIGPFAVKDLKRNGLKIDSQVFTEGMTQWQKAFTVPELRGLFPAKEVEKLLPRMFAKPFSFKGRIRRKEYALTWAIYVAVSFICGIVFAALSTVGTVLYILLNLALLWFILAQGAKRCHDYNDEGKAQAIPIIIVYFGGYLLGVVFILLYQFVGTIALPVIVILYVLGVAKTFEKIFITDGDEGANNFGEDPKASLNLTEAQREEIDKKVKRNYWLIVGGVTAVLALLSSIPQLLI